MKKCLLSFCFCLTVMVGMGVFAEHNLAGPPEGGGMPPIDGAVSLPIAKPGDGPGIIPYGPPEGGG